MADDDDEWRTDEPYGPDKCVPYDGGATAHKAKIESILARSPITVFGRDLIVRLASELEESRKHNLTSPVTAARLALRLRPLAKIGADMVAGQVQAPCSSSLRSSKMRKEALQKLHAALTLIGRAETSLRSAAFTGYVDPEFSMYACEKKRIASFIEIVEAERGPIATTRALRPIYLMARSIVQTLTGRGGRTVDRENGEEKGPLYGFVYELVLALDVGIPETQIASAIQSLMREKLASND